MNCERCGAELVEGIDKCLNCGLENALGEETSSLKENEVQNEKRELVYTPNVPSIIEIKEEIEKKTSGKKWILKVVSSIVAIVSLAFCFYGAYLLSKGSALMSGDVGASFGMMQLFGTQSYMAFAPVFDGFAHFVRGIGIVSAYFVVYCGFTLK